jgi:Fe-S cluster assembly protein SufD
MHPWDLPTFALAVKDRAMKALTGKSFPTKKDENYRHTMVTAALEQPLTVSRPSMNTFSMEKIRQIPERNIPGTDSYSIILRNGYYLNNEPVHKLPNGVVLGSCASLTEQPDGIHDFFSNHQYFADVLVNLNTMLSGDGFFLHVPANAKLSKPIRIINQIDGPGNILVQPRSLIIMEPGSSADIVICDRTLSGEPYVCNDVTEIVLNKNSALNLTRIQQVNPATNLITHTIVRQLESSRMKTHYVSMNGKSIRNNLSITLSEKYAGHTVKGLAFTRQTEHTDNHVLVTHASSDCNSNQLFRHILSGTSTGAFTGRIVVAGDAQKTSAYQRSSNILLNPEAKMNIRPQLEIYADDVKCSHGATVGQLDMEALFYLRSRGISESEARKILLRAFAGEIVNDITCEPVKNEAVKLIEQKMMEDL